MEPLSVTFVLEADHVVVREPHQIRLALASLLEAPLEPEIQDVVQVDVRQNRGNGSTLRGPFSRDYSHAVFEHPGPQPFRD